MTICLHAVHSPQMTDRTNRHNSTNEEEWGSIKNLEEYGWLGNGEFFVVEEVGLSMGEIRKEWGNVLGCGGR